MPGAVLAVRFTDDGELVVSERVTRKLFRQVHRFPTPH